MDFGIIGNPGSVLERMDLTSRLNFWGIFHAIAQKDGVLVEYKRVNPENSPETLLSDVRSMLIGQGLPEYEYHRTVSGKVLVNFK